MANPGDLAVASDVVGDWATYTPTYAGITAGNAVVTARYVQVQNLVHVRFRLVAGTTTSFSATTLTVSVPVAVAADYAVGDAIGAGYALDNSAGSASRTRLAALLSPSAVFFLSGEATGTVTNLVPWTWATSDVLSFTATYESV